MTVRESPASGEEVAEILRAAHADRRTVGIVGGDSASGLHAPGDPTDVEISTRGLSGIREYAPADLVLVAGAGTPVAEIDAMAAEHGQEVLFDSPADRYAAGATLGGLLATRAGGPRRLTRLPLRDVVLGTHLVLADGTRARIGGKVVKNVAGYDLSKVLVGSWGTLGLVTRVAVRMHPKPAVRAFTSYTPGSEDLGQSIVRSAVAASAVEFDRAPGGVTRVTVLQEHSLPLRTLPDLAFPPGSTATEVDARPPEHWGMPPVGPVRIRVSTTMRRLGDMMRAVSRAEAELGCGLHVRGSAAGVCEIGQDSADVATTRDVLDRLRAEFGDPRQGAAWLVLAPPEVWAGVDAFGPVPGLGLMRRIKEQFDPEGILCPGRSVPEILAPVGLREATTTRSAS